MPASQAGRRGFESRLPLQNQQLTDLEKLDGRALDALIEAESHVRVGHHGFEIGQPFVKDASFQTTDDVFMAE